MGTDKEQHSSSSGWSNKKQTLHKPVCALPDYYKKIGYTGEYTDTGIKEELKRRSRIEEVTTKDRAHSQKELSSDKS